MPKSSETPEQVALYRMGFLYMGIGASILITPILEHFHTTTELSATEDKTVVATFKIAVIVALFAGALSTYLTRKLKIGQRIVLPLLLMIEVTVAASILLHGVSLLLQAHADFPSGKTHIQHVPLKIARAYHQMAKGGGQTRGKYIQLAPAWTWPDFKITDEDYQFMVDNGPSGEIGYYEVPTDGRFCARLTTEQSSNSIRILHSQSDRLPKGTVILCPTSTGQPSPVNPGP